VISVSDSMSQFHLTAVQRRIASFYPQENDFSFHANMSFKKKILTVIQ